MSEYRDLVSTSYLSVTRDLVKHIETSFLELGARLYMIQKQELFKGNFDSFMEFVDAIGLKRSFASTLTAIHRAYVVEREILPVELAEAGYAKLYDAIPLLESQDTKMVMAKVLSLSRSELQQEVREEKHGECEHKETIMICASCHKRI